MRTLPRVVHIGLVLVVVGSAFPSLAAAQHTLTGRLTELFPGGTVVTSGFVSLNRVNPATGFSESPFRSLNPCVAPATTDCVAADGSFNATDLPAGLYFIRADASFYIEKFVNATVSGPTNVGDIPLIKEPFQISTIADPISAAGGVIPVSVRVRTRWNVPTLPISVRLGVDQDGSNGRFRFETGQVIDVVWPAGLTDSGVVPLTTLTVPADAAAGSVHCTVIVVTLRNNPAFELGRATSCGSKRP
jgi:hypothetical protein